MEISVAQVTSDGTVNTQVNQNGNVSEITGGEREGDNLFHSFQDFSVDTGNEASFLNANDIANIFSRVTGGNISNIDGLVSANGSANLFLINPAGIIFGENARLDVGGSFYGSTADSILFDEGEFSATDLENPPVLTINAPIGLNLRDQPADIVNRSVVEDSTGETVGLEVAPGNNLAFIGGDINFDRGNLTARGGNIQLGGLSQAGIVNINEDVSFSFPEDVTKADIALSNAANVNARGTTGGGSITVDARNLNLTAGESGNSSITTGIRPESTSAEAQAGDITIDVAEKITLDDGGIGNQVDIGGVGNSGNITITTGSLEAINGGEVSTSTFGQGNAGAVNLTATGDMIFDGENSEGFPSGVFSSVDTDAVGDAGNITISTSNLTLTNGGTVNADTLGQGNAGLVDINATESIALNDASISSTLGLEGLEATGNSGEINIDTPNLSLANFSSIDASTYGQGNAGSIDINATEAVTLDDSDISSTVSIGTVKAKGNGGELNITTPNLSLTNFSSIAADTFGQGNAGNLNITSANLSLNGSSISADIFGQGDGGSIDINATESITLDDSDISNSVTSVAEGNGNGGDLNITTPNLSLNGSSIDADTGGQGDAGKLNINTSNLSLTDFSSIDVGTWGRGDGGSVNINATESITLNDLSSISSTVSSDTEGNGGELNITTPNLSLTKNSSIGVETFGQGNGGKLSINTVNLSLTNFSSITGETFGQGNGGLIDINATESITFNDLSSISSRVTSLGEGNGGNIQISTGDFSINNAIVNASTSGMGNGGEINITANNLSLTNGGAIGASTYGFDAENITQGDGGNITINVADNLSLNSKTNGDSQGSGILASNEGNSSGNAGNIDITTSKLSLINGGQINSFTDGGGNAGNTTINAQDSIFLSGEDSEGNFNSGVFNNVDEAASGNGGTIKITTENLDIVDGAAISTESTGKGDAGLVDINADVVALDNGDISAEAFNNVNGGNLKINADVIVALPGKDSNIFASAQQGEGGNITINADSVLGIEQRPLSNSTSDINASSQVRGLDGSVRVNTLDVNPVEGATQLPTNVIEPEQTTQQ
ncbi:MAG: beta strand repeat-containing protein, partial [Waterburya sp.]